MTVERIDPRSSLARARLFAPRTRRRRVRVVIAVAFVLTDLAIIPFPHAWLVLSLLLLALFAAFALTDVRPTRRK